MRHVLGFLAAAFTCMPSVADGLKPWATNTHPSDVARSHVDLITQTDQKYTIFQGGTMDGRNCRSPMGCGMAREGTFLQTWESNRSVRMENVGDTDVVNPWLSNGRNNFRSIGEIVSSAVAPDISKAEIVFRRCTESVARPNVSKDFARSLRDREVTLTPPCRSPALVGRPLKTAHAR